MPTSQIPSMLSEISAGLPIPLEKRAYFHARVLNNFYQYILKKFLEEERAGRLTRADLARRIERRPEIVTRLLGAPGNWTLETATDLLLGISGEELVPSSIPLIGRPTTNYHHHVQVLMAPESMGTMTRSFQENMSFNVQRETNSTNAAGVSVFEVQNAPV